MIRRLPVSSLMSACLLLALSCVLSGCAGIFSDSPPTPSSLLQALPTIPDGAPNAPLLPGHERPDRDMSSSDPDRPLVLLAISGGGSRSAYYAASVMEQLSRIQAPGAPAGRSVLDEVRVMSTISGGGLAAAYYVTHFDKRHEPGFYEPFKKAMAVNLQWRTYGHMVKFPPLALGLLRPSVTRTDMLAEEIQRLLNAGPVTFDDLNALETRPVDPVPTLIVNGTVYNSGQRLAFTNLPAKRFPSLDQSDDSGVSLGASDREILRNLVQPLTFEDFGSDIGPFRLSRALAASAAYPIALAPITLRTYPGHVPTAAFEQAIAADAGIPIRKGARSVNGRLLLSPVLYVADGGIHENEGLDSLLSLIQTVPRRQPVMLIVIDGTVRMETMILGPGKVWGPISVISRLHDIGNLRPLALYGAAASRFHDPDRLRTVVIRMEGYDPATDKMLQSIPTAFKLSDRHRQALDTAALQNVEHMFPNLQEAYVKLTSGGDAVPLPTQKAKPAARSTARKPEPTRRKTPARQPSAQPVTKSENKTPPNVMMDSPVALPARSQSRASSL